jgi:hypothetical protein
MFPVLLSAVGRHEFPESAHATKEVFLRHVKREGRASSHALQANAASDDLGPQAFPPSHDFGQGDAQAFRQSPCQLEARHVLPPLDFRHAALVEVTRFSDFLLGQARRLPNLLADCAKRFHGAEGSIKPFSTQDVGVN